MPHPNKELLNDFVGYISTEKGLSSNTIKSYIYDLKSFFTFINKKKIELKKVQADNIIEYFCVKIENDYSYRSLNRVMTTLKLFYKYLILEGIINSNPTKQIDSPRFGKYLPAVLSLDEINALISFPPSETYSGMRDKAMMELMYSAGMRVSEICKLKLIDIDMVEKFIFIKGKGNHERYVPYGEQADLLLNNYLHYSRPFLVKKKQVNELFLNEKRGTALSRQGLWFIIRKYIDMLGVGKKVVPHTLRHSFATHLLSEGADLRSIQELLGHTNISTTQIYTQIEPVHLKKVHELYHPMK